MAIDLKNIDNEIISIDNVSFDNNHIRENEIVTIDPKLGYNIVKRTMDIVLCTFALAVLAIPLMLVALAIKIESKGPVFYSSKRVGKDGKVFNMYKFRSMVVNAEEMKKDLIKQGLNESDGPVFKMENDPRVTKVGKFIRKLSIDELPQLLNIIKGDMSIVGPRPPIPYEVDEYTPYQMQRLSVKPGLTCYWQVMGRSNIGFEQWVELDLKYIRERSILLDIKLIALTIPTVLLGKGAF